MTSSISPTVSETNEPSISPTMTSSRRLSISPSKLLTPSLSSLALYTSSSTIVPTQTPTVYESYSIMTTDVDLVKTSITPSPLRINDPNNMTLTLSIGVPIIIISLIIIIVVTHRKKSIQIQQPQNIIIVHSPAWVNENPAWIRQNPPELNV